MNIHPRTLGDGADWTALIGAGINAASNIFGKQNNSGVGAQPAPQPVYIPVQQPAAAPAKEKDNTVLYVGIGAGVLILLGGVYALTRK